MKKTPKKTPVKKTVKKAPIFPPRKARKSETPEEKAARMGPAQKATVERSKLGVKRKMSLRFKLTDGERLAYSREIAEQVRNRSEVDANRKAAAAQYKSELDRADSTIQEIGGKLETGYEYRDANVKILFDTPRKGRKSIMVIDPETDLAEFHSEVAMTPNDSQTEIDL